MIRNTYYNKKKERVDEVQWLQGHEKLKVYSAHTHARTHRPHSFSHSYAQTWYKHQSETN